MTDEQREIVERFLRAAIEELDALPETPAILRAKEHIASAGVSLYLESNRGRVEEALARLGIRAS